MSRFFITVSIPYVNAAPHVGYALELVQADVLARAHRQVGDEVRFLGGTDDHALKNVLAAEAANVATADFVDANADRFARLAGPLAISFDDFIRTSSDPRHAPGVERLWRQSAARGDFYRQFYEGRYCVGCEQFYAAVDLVEGCCPEHGTAAEWVGEENWFFRLSRYAEPIMDAIETGAMVILPEGSRNEVLAWLRSGLSDISVSRSERRARGWGIAVPDDPDQVVYVWWDALANYITALDYGSDGEAFRRWWLEADERVHVIGKGILRFHALYWPALLLSAGLPLPTRVYVHPYLTVDGEKISKSTGNGPDPAELAGRFGADALRWWLCREVTPGADADFSVERLVSRFNEDLANGVGNLAARVAAMVARFRHGTIPDTPEGPSEDQVELWQQVGGLGRVVRERIDAFDFRSAATSVTDAVSGLNRYIEECRPWVLAREESAGSPTRRDRLDQVLGFLVGAVGQIAAAASPLIPAGAARILAQIGSGGGRVSAGSATFPRLDQVTASARAPRA
ncbi:MAG: methionine--tRNA ligase [Acidimicrobiales bacterium]